MGSHTKDWGQAQRILCVRLDSLGDVLNDDPGDGGHQKPAVRTVTLL